jgi:hypothetical protein
MDLNLLNSTDLKRKIKKIKNFSKYIYFFFKKIFYLYFLF